MAGFFKKAVSALAKSKLAKGVIGKVLPKIAGGIPFVGGIAEAGLEFAGDALSKQGKSKGKAAAKTAVSNIQVQQQRSIMESAQTGAQGGGAKMFSMEHIKKNWYYYAAGAGALIGVLWYMFGKKKVRRR